jgi:hypothetical protein
MSAARAASPTGEAPVSPKSLTGSRAPSPTSEAVAGRSTRRSSLRRSSAASSISRPDSAGRSHASGSNEEEVFDWSGPEYIEVTLDPGPLGLEFDIDTGRVHGVPDELKINEETGKKIDHGRMRGIKPGWVLCAIDGEPYTWALLKSKMRGAKAVYPYKCVFSVPDHKVPKKLWMISPHGNKECSGLYEIVPKRGEDGRVIPGTCPNYMRMWKQKDQDRWIYGSNSMGWSVAGIGAKQRNFNCTIAEIATVVGHGNEIMPHEILGDWKRITEDKKWVIDPAIKCYAVQPGSWKRI